ncbi:jg7975, partial [Pararge aegeria aegeria]
ERVTRTGFGVLQACHWFVRERNDEVVTSQSASPQSDCTREKR